MTENSVIINSSNDNIKKQKNPHPPLYRSNRVILNLPHCLCQILVITCSSVCYKTQQLIMGSRVDVLLARLKIKSAPSPGQRGSSCRTSSPTPTPTATPADEDKKRRRRKRKEEGGGGPNFIALILSKKKSLRTNSFCLTSLPLIEQI